MVKWSNLNGFGSDADETLEAVRSWAFDQGILKLGKNEAFVPRTDRKLNAYESLTAFLGSEIAPQSKISGKSAIRLFLIRNGVSLSNEDIKEQVSTKIRLYRVTKDRAPTLEELRDIVLHGSLRLKVAVGLMATGGLRVGEVSELRVGWITWGNDGPTSILIPAQITKAKKERTTFVSSEIAKLLREYLEKEGKLQDPNAKIFAGNSMILRRHIADLLKRLGLRTKKPGSRGYELHAHVFRKFFYTKLQNAGMPQGLIDVLVGHESPLASAYGRSTNEEMAAEYAKHEDALLILGGSTERVRSKSADFEEASRLLSVVRGWPVEQAQQRIIDYVLEHHSSSLVETRPGGRIESGAKGAGIATFRAVESLTWQDSPLKEAFDSLRKSETATPKTALETRRFSNHEYEYIKCILGGDDFDNALIQGFEVYSQSGDSVYLRKPRVASA